MTDAHLGLLQWTACSEPKYVRRLETPEDAANARLTGPGGRHNMVPGWQVEYVAPTSVLRQAVTQILETLDSLSTDERYTSRVYISGPSGSGKSRIGWQIYCEVKESPRLAGVAFFSVMMGKPENENSIEEGDINSVADLVRKMVHTSAKGPLGARLGSNIVTTQLTLEAVARHLSGWKEGAGRTALVLNIDEFQRNPEVVINIQKAISEANEALNGDVVILPICTGLYNKSFHTHKDIDASKHSCALYLGYLSTSDGAADHESTWRVVRNACIAVRGVDVLPETLDQLKEVSPVLRYLVEDLGGWPMAAVQLGGQLAAQAALKAATKPGDVVWAMVQLNMCETEMDKVLERRYSVPVTSFNGHLADEGVFKLVILLLSPFPVRRQGRVGETEQPLRSRDSHCPFPHRSGWTSPSTA